MQPMNPRIPVKITVPIIALILVGVLGLNILQSSRFHVTGTEPSINSVATVAPFFKINFNRQLSLSGLEVSATNSIVSSEQVSGQTLVIGMGSVLNQNTSYTITVALVHDTKGDKLTNLHFTFQPKDIAFNNLPKDQQQAILKQQANQPYTVNSITYIGFNTLLTDGLSIGQTGDLQQAIFQYSQSISAKFSQVTIPDNSVQPVPHDPNSSSMTDTINCNLQIGATTYPAKIEYSGLNSLELFLYNAQTNAQIYDSGTISPS